MKKSLVAVAFLVIFLLLTTLVFAEPILNRVERISENIRQELYADENISIEARKINLDILGLLMERIDGKWIVRASDFKTSIVFNEELQLVSVEDIKGENIFKELLEKESEEILDFKDQVDILSFEWDGKDRINSQDLDDGESDSNSFIYID